jgi:hypothetical protein
MHFAYHIIFATITLILSYSLIIFYLFGKDIHEQLLIATNPNIIHKLDGPTQQTTFKRAAKTVEWLYRLVLPLAAVSTSITVFTWIYVGLYDEMIWGINYIGPIIIALYATIVLNTDTDPEWLLHWENLHEHTIKLIYIEFIEHRLHELKLLLQDAQNGTHFDPEELKDIKLESLVLSQEAFYLNGEHQAADDLQPLIDSFD